MPFTPGDFLLLANGDDVIEFNAEEKGFKIKRIYFSNGKIIKLSRGDERFLEGEIWNSKGDLERKVVRYKNPHIKITRSTTSSVVKEEVAYPDGNIRCHLYRLDNYNPQNLPSLPISANDVNGEMNDRNLLPKYEMSSKPRGFCVIINNDFPKMPSRQRNWSLIDKNNLTTAWEKLGFEIKLLENLNTTTTMDNLREIATKPELSKHHCFVLVILTHGSLNEIECDDNESIHFTKIFEIFNHKNCEALKNKPKLFFSDACRDPPENVTGENIAAAPEYDYFHKNLKEAINGLEECLYKDMIISYATCSGQRSFATNDRGSWFVKALCDTLNKNGSKHEIADLLRIIDSLVSSQKFPITNAGNQNNDSHTQCTEFKFIGVNHRLYFPSLD